APVPDWVEAFTAALRRRLLEGDVAGALDWTALPAARLNHPTPEHLLPLFVALGAGGGAPAGLLHEDVELGALALDAYAFGLHDCRERVRGDGGHFARSQERGVAAVGFARHLPVEDPPSLLVLALPGPEVAG